MNTISSNKKSLKIFHLMNLTVFLTVLCTWSYGNNYTVYAFVSLLLVAFTYYNFFKNTFYKCSVIELWVCVCLIISLCTCLVNGSLKSMILTNTSLLLPFVISYFNIDISSINRKSKKSAYIAMAFSLFLLLTTDEQNSNTQAIIMYTCMSISYIWFFNVKSKAEKFAAIIYSILMLVMIFLTGSRNTAIVALICLLILILLRKSFKTALLFRILYISAMALTVFAIPFMTFVFSNNKIMDFLMDFTSQFSDKWWGMSSHLNILIDVKSFFEELPLLSQLLGEGVKSHHCHNIFYQCLFFYGYIGTTFIYAFYIYIFEIGFKLFKQYNDKLSISCCSMLIGFFLLQCGETFMLGSETAMMIGAFPVGIILHQNRLYKATQNVKKEQIYVNS